MERMRTLEVSLGGVLKRSLGLAAAAYWNQLHDGLQKETLAGDTWRWVNAGRIETLGLEAEAELLLGSFRAFANYAYTRSRDAPRGSRWRRSRAPGPTPASVTASRTASARPSGPNWITPNPQQIAATGDDTVAAAFVLDAALSWLDLRGFNFQVIARNLLNGSARTSNRLPDRYRQPQRTFLVNAAYRF